MKAEPLSALVSWQLPASVLWMPNPAVLSKSR
jgi:hypothetical protein